MSKRPKLLVAKRPKWRLVDRIRLVPGWWALAALRPKFDACWVWRWAEPSTVQYLIYNWRAFEALRRDVERECGAYVGQQREPAVQPSMANTLIPVPKQLGLDV